ncbi:MAG: hypothetical protein V2A71_09660 [Candidatus Eisenbacteria bacterium]
MFRHGCTTAAIALASLAFLLAGHFLVLQRSEPASEEFLRIRGDSIEYLRMAEGEKSVPSPFRYRVLVPAVVSWLPLDARAGFLLLSYSSLFFSCFVLGLILKKLGLGAWGLPSGLFVFIFSEATLYQFHNPYLADAAGTFFLFLLFLAALDGRAILFAGAVTAGLLCREATLFAVPIYAATRRLRAFVAILLAGAAVFLLPRALSGAAGSEGQYFAAYLESARELGRLSRLDNYVRSVFYTWDVVWFLAALGFLFAGKRALLLLLLALLSLAAGAFLSGIVTTDIGRMFSLVAPPLVCLSAFTLERVRARSLAAWSLVLAFVAWRAMFSVPTVLNPTEYALSGLEAGRRILGVACLIVSAVVLVALRSDIRNAFQNKALRGGLALSMLLFGVLVLYLT